MTTFIQRLPATGTGPRLAVKDVVDVAGALTSAGCPALADRRTPATVDAACLSGARAANARLVGKTNLHELAFGTTGVNPWYGTAVNPLDPALVPGGSSSGSAVAVATDEADVALGTDTGGSVRIPSACCGTAGLKTTWGRIPREGVIPLAPTLDTIGPMAASVAGVVAGMALLEPGFGAAESPGVVGRLRGLDADAGIDAAIDRALAAAGLEVVDVRLPGWAAAHHATVAVLLAEAWQAHGGLLSDSRRPLGRDVADRLAAGRDIGGAEVAAARRRRRAWRAELAAVFDRVGVIALPTLLRTPPTVAELAAGPVSLNAATAAVNLAGHPALALAVPADLSVPAGLQLVGPDGSEEILCGLGRRVEAAVAAG